MTGPYRDEWKDILKSGKTNTLWPPATKDLSADEQVKLRRIAVDLLEHLLCSIPKQCTAEGHIWDNPDGTRHMVREGQHWVEDDDTFGGLERDHSYGYKPPGHMAGGYDVPYYKRTCTRCGCIEELCAIQTQEIQPFKTLATATPAPAANGQARGLARS